MRRSLRRFRSASYACACSCTTCKMPCRKSASTRQRASKRRLTLSVPACSGSWRQKYGGRSKRCAARMKKSSSRQVPQCTHVHTQHINTHTHIALMCVGKVALTCVGEVGVHLLTCPVSRGRARAARTGRSVGSGRLPSRLWRAAGTGSASSPHVQFGAVAVKALHCSPAAVVVAGRKHLLPRVDDAAVGGQRAAGRQDSVAAGA